MNLQVDERALAVVDAGGLSRAGFVGLLLAAKDVPKLAEVIGLPGSVGHQHGVQDVADAAT